MISELITIKDIAKYLKFNPETIRRLIKNGGLPCYKISKSYRFRIAEVNQWLKKQNDKSVN